MSIATTLKTFNIGKAKDANGKEIEPEVGWTTGLVMCVALHHFQPSFGESVRLFSLIAIIFSLLLLGIQLSTERPLRPVLTSRLSLSRRRRRSLKSRSKYFDPIWYPPPSPDLAA